MTRIFPYFTIFFRIMSQTLDSAQSSKKDAMPACNLESLRVSFLETKMFLIKKAADNQTQVFQDVTF